MVLWVGIRSGRSWIEAVVGFYWDRLAVGVCAAACCFWLVCACLGFGVRFPGEWV